MDPSQAPPIGVSEPLIVYPHAQWDGCLTITCKDQDALDRLIAIEQSKKLGRFRVRASITDASHPGATLPTLLEPVSFSRIRLQQPSQLLYLHHGGYNAVYYRLVSDGSSQNYLSYVEVVVETTQPRFAARLGRTAINRLLDAQASAWGIAASIVRLDLLTEDSEQVLVTELTLPHIKDGTLSTHIAGMHQSPLFTPWLSTLREAITSNSPYWRFLCAWRAYEGISVLRQHIKTQCARMKILAPLPKDIEVNAQQLAEITSIEHFKGVKTAADLFGNFKKLRTGVAHFIMKDGATVDFSDGGLFTEYSIAGVILLQISTDSVLLLHKFYEQHVERITRIGSILPQHHLADKFFVRHPGLSQPLSDGDFR